MSDLYKIAISIILIITVPIFLYLGAFAPFKKSKMYMDSIKSFYAAETLSKEDFVEKINKSLDYYSPVGHEIITDFYMRFLADAINKQIVQNEEVAVFLVENAEEKAISKSMKHNLFMGQLYSLVFQMTEDKEYFQRSEKYFLKAKEMGPKMPQILESLAIIYTLANEGEKLDKIAEEILELWPDHPAVQTN